MTIERDIARAKMARTLEDLGNGVGRTIQQTTNSFNSIVATATAARAEMVALPAFFDAADIAFVDAQISALGQNVTDTAVALVNSLPGA